MADVVGPDCAAQNLLRETIARAEARLVELDVARAVAEKALSEARSRLAELYGSAERPQSVADKIALFRSLFAGRTDVFPKQWHNSEAGKKGYAPVCANEWVRGVCEKPRIRCGECPRQAFVPVTDRVVLDHLQGRHVVGVYPLLADETCRFLAVDFDKGRWQDDVTAFVAMCRRFELPVAIERSQSGNGAHGWFFFSTPIPAATARRMAWNLLMRIMRDRRELDTSSYDRLFPNQDTMPRGGFGNLIALPLQYRARQSGNTVFVDEAFVAYPDQWEFLANLRRIDRERVDEVVRETEKTTERDAVYGGEERERTTAAVTAPRPSEIRIILNQGIFIEKEALPTAIFDRVVRLAEFHNPEFYRKQALRFSVAHTPRVISCASQDVGYLRLPRGCLEALRELFAGFGVQVVVEDRRSSGEPLEVSFQGRLTELQTHAAEALLAHEQGVLVAPPGTGKTVVGAYLVAARGRSTLVLVHRTQLLDQWRAQLALFLGVPPGEIGQIGGEKRSATGRIDVATLQSLIRCSEVGELAEEYGHVIVDECHHVPAASFERVMSAVRPRYVTGLTATPQRRDGHHPILAFQLGPIRFAVDRRSDLARYSFQRELTVRKTAFRASHASSLKIQELYEEIANDAARNDLIVRDVVNALKEGRSPIVLTERRDHVDLLAARLGGHVDHLVVLRGGMRAKERCSVIEQLRVISEGESRLVIATGRFVGEGFDDTRLDALFLAMPVAWKGTLVQYVGRLHRMHRIKTAVRVCDYVDREVPLLVRMFEKRMRGYRAMGYVVQNDNNGASGFRVGKVKSGR